MIIGVEEEIAPIIEAVKDEAGNNNLSNLEIAQYIAKLCVLGKGKPLIENGRQYPNAYRYDLEVEGNKFLVLAKHDNHVVHKMWISGINDKEFSLEEILRRIERPKLSGRQIYKPTSRANTMELLEKTIFHEDYLVMDWEQAQKRWRDKSPTNGMTVKDLFSPLFNAAKNKAP